MTDPALIDTLGQEVDSRTDDAIEGHLPASRNFDFYATRALAPLGWQGGKPDGSRQIGWTLQRAGQVIAEHAFNINPQSITRTDSSRTQLQATQGAFYVDDFGAGATTIQLTQLVASGRSRPAGGGAVSRSTMRQDVVRFYDEIYMQATTAGPASLDCYFHDNHFWDSTDGKSPELVYFPPQGFQVVRAVQQHNVWLIQVTMVTLSNPNKPIDTPPVPGRPKLRIHVVQRGETLTKIAARLAGRHGTHKRRLQLEQQIVALTRKYGNDDITKTRQVALFSNTDPTQQIATVKVKRMHLTPGERIVLPAG